MTLRFNFVLVPAKQVRPGHLFDQSLNHGGPQSPVPLSPPSGHRAKPRRPGKRAAGAVGGRAPEEAA